MLFVAGKDRKIGHTRHTERRQEIPNIPYTMYMIVNSPLPHFPIFGGYFGFSWLIDRDTQIQDIVRCYRVKRDSLRVTTFSLCKTCSKKARATGENIVNAYLREISGILPQLMKVQGKKLGWETNNKSKLNFLQFCT